MSYFKLQDQAATEGSQAGTKGTIGAGQLEALWTVVVQDVFTSSHERKALGFQLFTILLPHFKQVLLHHHLAFRC